MPPTVVEQLHDVIMKNSTDTIRKTHELLQSDTSNLVHQFLVI